MNKSKRRIVAMVSGIVLAAGSALAGELTPPGAPGPTMHTLTEIYDLIDGLQQQVADTKSELQQQITDMQQQLNTIKQRQGAAGFADTVDGMVLIPAGSFQMGDAFAEGSASERPMHEVTVSAFYMDQYPVTKALWDEVLAWATGQGYTDLSAGEGKGPSHPVHTVNWYDALKWANARSERDGLTPVYGRWVLPIPPQYIPVWQVYRTGEYEDIVFGGGNGYRLPTEAEWEKAARGGTEGRRFSWADGNTISHTRANYWASPSSYDYDVSSTLGHHPDYSYSGSMTPYTSPVGSFAPNGYGLYDMIGNVSEWCWDWYLSTYYSSSTGIDPRGPASGTSRVRRGGSWSDFALYIRCASRSSRAPAVKDNRVGFRCVRGL